MKSSLTKKGTRLKKPKVIRGYGVVGTWVSPATKLGGAMPQWLEDNESRALYEANDNPRLLTFQEYTEQWLCEITIKPIRKLELVSKNTFK
jgi:hypothetical protein